MKTQDNHVDSGLRTGPNVTPLAKVENDSPRRFLNSGENWVMLELKLTNRDY